jgi:hypothetical protein
MVNPARTNANKPAATPTKVMITPMAVTTKVQTNIGNSRPFSFLESALSVLSSLSISFRRPQGNVALEWIALVLVSPTPAALADVCTGPVLDAHADRVRQPEIYFFNRRLEYLGPSLEDVHGWGWTAAIHPEDVASF